MSHPLLHHSPPRGWRWPVAWLVGGLLVGAVIAFILFRIGLKSYLHSDGFRRLLSERTAAAFDVTGEYQPFRWTGWSVHTDGFAGRGATDSPIHEMEADQIRAELAWRGFYHRTWEARGLTIRRLRVQLDTGATTHAAPPRAPAARASGGWWGTDRFPPPPLDIEEGALLWNQDRANSGRVERVRARLEPRDDAWWVTGRGGQLRQAGLPPLTIDEIRLRQRADWLYITSARFKVAETGQLEAQGELGFGEPSSLTLTLTGHGIPAEQVLPPDWRARVTGQLAGTARVTGNLRDSAALRATGTLQLRGGALHALPLLDQIAVFTGAEQFRRLTLQTATAEFDWQPGRVEARELVLESEGLLRVEGGFTVRDGQMDGACQLGVSAATLRWLPGSRARVFTEERGGYLWTTVRLSGPVARIQEDLTPRLLAAAQAEAIEGAKRGFEEGARELLEWLRPLLP